VTIAIIGLGYVGLPLCLQFARRGVRVLGLDIDVGKVSALNAGRSYLKHIPAGEIKKLVRAGKFSASADFSLIGGSSRGHEAQIKTILEPPHVGSYIGKIDAILICVPTPLKKNRTPDLSFVLNTGRSIARHLQRGQLVVLESTTYPGTTENELRAVLEKGSGLKAGKDFHLAFSPEREDPGNPTSNVANIPKVIGGYTPACLAAAQKVYSRAIRTLVPVANCRTAEAAKLLENVFRGVNIALVNELKGVYAALDIDIWDVIAAAKTKPFGFMPFYPGPGLGGHCIPIDPFYLAWKARQVGQETRFVELAGEINRAMPEKVIARVAQALRSGDAPSPAATRAGGGANTRRRRVVAATLRGKRILVLGLAYKANVEDERESPSYRLLDLLTARGAEVAYHDPYVPVIKPTREHPHWAGTKSVKWSRKMISSFDAVLISTAHDAVDYQQLADWSPLIVDTRNVMAKVKVAPGKVWPA
jgi:UDP-N-acetyl-D-glucosamine dehydrogenase